MDAVVNHMSGLGRVGTGDGGSTYNGDALDFPGVPFKAEHFTPRDQCPSGDGNFIFFSTTITANCWAKFRQYKVVTGISHYILNMTR